MVNRALTRHAGAVFLYAAASWLFIDHGISLTQQVIGTGSDPLAYIWFIAWLPYALAHHLNPFYTYMVWQPEGLNLAWRASVLLLALLAMPITLLGGPLLAYNLLLLAAPFTAALAAYALCVYLTRQPAAALPAGFIFGFSSYEMAQAMGHLNLVFTALLPLLLLLAMARLDGALTRRQAVLGAGLLLAGQFSISLELFATSLLFGGIAWALAWLGPPARRLALMRLVVDSLWLAPFLALLLSPLLYVMFAFPHQFVVPSGWPKIFSIDPFNLLVPTANTAAGGALADPISQHFTGLLGEQSGYMGFFLLAITIRFCRGRNVFFGLMLGAIILLSLGPQLWLNGMPTGLPLPWALGEQLPFMQDVLPVRFMVYAFLLAGIITALWLAAAPPEAQLRRRVLATLACCSLLPVLHPGQPSPALRFFAPGRVQTALGPAPRLLILPFGIVGDSSFWQVENQFGFVQTGGYLGPTPADFWHDLPMLRFSVGLDTPGFPADFAAYCRRTGTQFVVAAPSTAPSVMAEVTSLSWPAKRVDDVTVFTVPQ